jgi:hypothetical protein
MKNARSQRSTHVGRLWVVLLAMAVAGSWGCGGTASAAGPVPTPTPTPVPTPTPTPAPLPAGTIGMKVLSTSVPPGGIFQWQLSNTEPKPIGHGSTRPQVPAGPVRGVAVNDPSGKAAGIAVVNGSNIAIQLSSPDALLGTDITYPVVTMSMPLSASFTPGQTFPIGIDTANTLFADASKNYTTLEFAPGTLTIAPSGSPYVSDVIPGGGLLPDRSVLRILGANFNANTRISIEGTTIVPADQTLVNSGEIDVKICNGTVADGATACPGNGTKFQLDGERVRVKDQGTNFTIEYYSYIRSDDAPGSSANTLVTEVHPMFSRQTFLSATVPLVNTATQFTGIALQNTSGTDDGIKVELLDAGNASLANLSFILPTGKKIARDVIEDWFPSPPAGAATVKITVTSGPALQVLGMLGDKSAGTVAPVIPQ